MEPGKTYDQLILENENLQLQLEEATETINAIRTGQVDALVVKGKNGHQLYTLKTADETYRVFIEKMNEGAVTLNKDGIILYCNSKFASIINMPLSKVMGLPFSSFITDDFLDSYIELFENGWLTDSKAELFIYNNERTIPCQLSVTTLNLDEGVALSVIITDLTDLKETQELLKINNIQLAEANGELEASNHDLQQFASIASHDLQEPLRKIMIFSTLLRDKHGMELTGDGGIFLEKIISSSNRMKTMIIDILSYSRLSDNGADFVMKNLKEIVKDVLEDYEIVIGEKNAKIIVGELPEIEVNSGQIRQVFQNLISNALKFSRPDVSPVIEISCKSATVSLWEITENEPFYEITIADNGIGFNDVYHEKIFSLFKRLNTKDKYEGSGIGLAITKKIIDKHNGKITAISKEGEGSKFIFILPLRQSF